MIRDIAVFILIWLRLCVGADKDAVKMQLLSCGGIEVYIIYFIRHSHH